jgi:hypothetical protein
MPNEPRPVIRSIAEVLWEEPPAHYGGAYSNMPPARSTTTAAICRPRSELPAPAPIFP